jgi:hypothetical protein
VKWGLQHVKVTLEESDSGEVVVIEQSSDGRITCVPARGKGGAANGAPRRGYKGNARKASDTPDVEETEVDAESEPEVTPKTASKPKASTRAKPAKPTKKPRASATKPGRRDTALTWEPVEDHDYHGFAAPSAAGQFKALITKGSQWALFYELKNTWPKHIGCFRSETKAKERAQELHDAGWPESEFGPVTAGQVATACPAPSSAPRAKRKTKAEEKEDAMPTTEEKPVTPPAAAPASTDAEKDKELMASFGRELKAVLDEDEDEDD